MNQKGLEPYGRIKIIRRRIDDHTYNDAWKEYGISDFLAKHDEIDHFAIIDDEMVDLHTFEDYVSLVDNSLDLNDEDFYRFYKDLEFRKKLCSERQGLQPKHLEEATKILKKENIFRGKIWE